MSLGPLAIPAPTIALPSPSFADRYQLGAVLAEGGLATVRDAHDVVLDRKVAVKQLRDRDPGLSMRFMREARLTSRLLHPGIVPVYDLGLADDGTPSYAMKWVAGRSLAEAIARAGGLDERLALVPAVIAIAEAIAYAHSQRVIHRDLKPANVMLGAFGEVVVIDWGLALEMDEVEDAVAPQREMRPADPRLTTIGSVLGTPYYMPPEQARGERVDHRADIYAVGAILYQLAAGAPPYDQRGVPPTVAKEPVWSQVAAGPPRPITSVVSGVPPELTAIIERAMARSSDDRYASASELATALAAFLTHQTSQRLSAAASDRVDELVAALAQVDISSAGAVGEIYRRADVARFGLEQAVAAWPGNPAAQRGLGRLRTALFDFELERDNLAAATQLAVELPADHNRQTALARRREVEGVRAAEVAATGREHDRRLGLRERLVLSVVLMLLLAMSLVMSLVTDVSLIDQPGLGALQLGAAVAVGVVALVLVVARRGLFANRASGDAARAVLVATTAVLANRLIAGAAGLAPDVLLTIDLVICAAVMLTHGRYAAAAPLAVTAVIAAVWSGAAPAMFNLGVLACAAALIVSWKREARASAQRYRDGEPGGRRAGPST